MPNRQAIIGFALIVIFAAAFYRLVSRVSFTSDLGTDGKVSVRFSAPSPWFSGTKSFIELTSSEREREESVHCYLTRFHRNNIPVHKGVTVSVDGRLETETTVADFIKAFEAQISDTDLAVPVLEYGDPNTPIGRNYLNPHRHYYSPDWGLFQIGEKNIWYPYPFSTGETLTLNESAG